MSLSASEFFEAVGQGLVGESWTAEIGSRVDEMVSGEVAMVFGEDVFAELADRRAARQGARDA